METELGLDGACEDGPPPQHACIGFNYGTDSNLSVDEAAAAVEARSTSSVALSAQRFMDAARIGDARTVSVYIAQYPMNVNSKEPLTGVTALMVAAAARQPHIVRLLLQAGADTAVCDHAGDSVVEWAVSDDSAAARSVMDLLIASPWPGLEPRLLKVLELCLSDSLPALFELVLFALSSLFVRKFLDSHPYDDPESLGHESALATQGRLGESFSIPIRAAQRWLGRCDFVHCVVNGANSSATAPVSPTCSEEPRPLKQARMSQTDADLHRLFQDSRVVFKAPSQPRLVASLIAGSILPFL